MLDDRTAALDLTLADLAGRVELLLDVSPVNNEEAWEASRADDHAHPPDLRYRPVGTPVDAVRRALTDLSLGDVGDPAVRDLLEDKRRELAAQLDLIDVRNTPAFLERSVELYGTADDRLLALAEGLLDRLPAPAVPDDLVGPEAYAERARAEITRYCEQDPTLRASVSVRDDVSSLMVVGRELLVGTDSWIPSHRVEPLVHHEVGVHLLTAETGGDQPLRLLEHGLAGYEETQEALGVLSEYLTGGLDAERMRTLAARALGARRLSDGAGFAELFAELHEEHDIPAHAAFKTVVRLIRGGGFTKDVIYLRGLVELVDHLADGGELQPLLGGKLHLSHVPAIAELLAGGVLVAPTLHPHWLDGEGPTGRLAALRRGETPVSDWP
jgi:uncharacterized protein (TIGR02421 family)